MNKYQFVRKPAGRNEPDWAAKIHFAIAPCYYHNYVLGELLASQLHHFILGNISEHGSYVNQPEIGAFLTSQIFAPAALFHWNDMIKKAVGEKLTPKYYVKEFIES